MAFDWDPWGGGSPFASDGLMALASGAPGWAEVRARVRPGPAEPAPGPGPYEVRWRWEADRGAVVGPHGRAGLRRVAPRRYEAEALVGERGVDDLVRALAACVVAREGGAVVHAAAVELDGRAVLFVGPSGAGKSTAATLVPGARIFVGDRANVLACDGVWRAAPLLRSGPTIDASNASPERDLPIAAILRVNQGRGAPRLERATGARAVVLVRESVMLGSTDPAEEGRCLELAARLAREVPVGVVHTVLGAPLTELLGRFVASGEVRP